MRNPLTKIACLAGIAVFATACAARVEVVAPKEPITINLNVKIEHEIRVKVDKELDDVFKEDKGLF
jgi:hypothetical protein